jgi:hypothetical protein
MSLNLHFSINWRITRVWLILLLLADIAAIGFGFGSGELHAVADENGPIENVQSFLLLLSCGIFLGIACVEKRATLTSVVLSLMSLSLLLREIDVDDPALGVSYIIIFFVQGGGRNAILSALWAIVILFIARDFRRHSEMLFCYLKSTSGLIAIAAGVVTALAWPFDHHLIFKGDLAMFCEEFIEMNGYALLLLAALHAPRSLRLISASSDDFSPPR